MAWTRVQLRVCRIRSLHPFCDIRSTISNFDHPSVWITHLKGAPENLGKHATEARQYLGVRGTGCPSSDDLGNWRQVQAHHAVLKKADALSVKQLCSHSSKCRK